MNKLSKIQFTVFALIILSILMHYVFYKNTGTFNSPIVKYEFVKTPDDVKDIFMTNNEFNKAIIKGVHDQNIIDYAYMIAYSTLLFMFFSKIKEFEKKKIFILGVILALTALITDAIENILLFNISELLTARNGFYTEIDILFIVTRIKWFSIAIALFIASFHYISYSILGIFFAVLSSLSFIFGIIYFSTQNEEILEYFSSSIMLGFVILMIWVFLPENKYKQISFYKETPFK